MTHDMPKPQLEHPQHLDRRDGLKIAYHHTPGKQSDTQAANSRTLKMPGVMFLGGFMSDMTGTKATHLEEHCIRQGLGYTRFDYGGHGQSSGKFADGTIGQWAADAIAVLDEITTGPQILVGSSMGGWIMLRVALARPERVAGLVGIAAAPDFTEDLMWAQFSDDQKKSIMEDGALIEPTDYGDDPYTITRNLIEDGRDQLVLRKPLEIKCPVRLVQGMKDPDVPWQTALRLTDALVTDDVRIDLIKTGDHRLSEPDQLDVITKHLDEILAKAKG
ncbi:alpha/beta hydrolase [Thalassospira lohafexi]|uniref:Alpha/beta hydrolase n=2 Tax=Thalassospira lohafexi TaxID=744227 RepID=A0A2N3L8P5_9PROT|nr:alpha/beta hydrolase [Thalassospira lohafexi]